MYKFSGYRRTTFKYSDAYKDLDGSEYVGEFRLLSFSKERYLGKYGDSGEQYLRVKAPKGATKDDVRQVADDFLSYHCRCEHDCCGHWQRSIGKVYHSKRNEYIVKVHLYQNV